MQFRNILFPTDFSDHSNRAMAYAAAWAERFGAKIRMMHVVTVHNYDPFNPDLGFPEVRPDPGLQDAAASYLDELAGGLSRRVEREIRVGFSPWNEIVTAASEHGSDLIVMATRGRKGLEKLFLGSTAEKVVEHAPCPVLLVRTQEEDFPLPDEINSILLPSDLTEEAGGAAPVALHLASLFRARLIMFHSIEQEIPPPYLAAGITSMFELNDEVRDAARTRLAELISDEEAESLEHDFVIREGNSAREIVAFAREAAVDLIVMATHGLSGLEQALLGSTTDRVIRHMPCPVLVVRSTGPEN